MKARFSTEKGIFIVDSRKDPCLYYAPHNPPNTGTAYTSGTNLSLHITKKGTKCFYKYHWSMWQGCECSIELITFDEANDFLCCHFGGEYGLTTEEALAFDEKYGFKIAVETA